MIMMARLFLCLCLAGSSAMAALPGFGDGQAMPELDRLFFRTNQWTGADGDYSVALPSGQTLWLYSDTWVGQVRDNHRVNTTLVNNTVALQEGRGTQSSVQFFVRTNDEGKAAAFVTPADRDGWFWLQSGAYADHRLLLFLAQIEKTGNGGAFGFRQTGQWLGVVANPLASPLDWRINQIKLPNSNFSGKHNVSYGAANVLSGNDLYVFGTEDTAGEHHRHLLVARVPIDAVTDFSAWRYYSQGHWTANSTNATGIADDMATEFSVSLLPKYGCFALVYTQHGLSPKIQVRTAAHPWGDWSAPTTVYNCPEMLHDHGVFCYAAKAHPTLGSDDRLVVTYAANSYDLHQVLDDASLYWPRFVSVPILEKK